MVKNELDAEKLKRKGYEEDIVRGITPLDHVKSTPKVNPPGVHNFPKQRTCILPDISQNTIPFPRQWMPVDVDTLQVLVAFQFSFASGTEHRHLISGVAKRTCLFPDPPVERNRQVLHYDKNF